MIPQNEKEYSLKTKGFQGLFEEQICLGAISNKEIYGIKSIVQLGNLITIKIKNDSCSKNHKNIRQIRVGIDFNLDKYKELIQSLIKNKYSYIGSKIVSEHGFTFRELRHFLATHQLIKTHDLSQVSRALGHKSKKNLSYYIDWDIIRELFGLEVAEQLVKSTEHGFQYSLMKLAVFSVLTEFFKDIG